MDNKRNVIVDICDLLTKGEFELIVKTYGTSEDLEVKKILEVVNFYYNKSEMLKDSISGRASEQYPYISSSDKFGQIILSTIRRIEQADKLSDQLSKTLQSEKEIFMMEDWLKTQYTNIFSKIPGLNSLESLSNSVLSEVVLAMNAQLGIFYIKKNSNEITNHEIHLDVMATYGISNSDKIQFKFGEGLIGQCAKDLQPIYINNIPQDFISISCGLGKAHPKSLIIMPILYEQELCGIIELASMNLFTDLQKKLLEQIVSNIGISIKNVSTNLLTEKLLGEIEYKNRSLDSQKQALDSAAIVAETDVRGKITYVNEKFLEISKYTRNELMGQDHRILNSGHHPKEFFMNLWKNISTGNVWNGEVKNKAKDGSYYWVDTTIYPVKDELGKMKKYVAIRFDITDKKRVLEELSYATVQAKSATKAKSEFLANMSHEIRTPMNAIIALAELLADTRLSAEQKKYVNLFQIAGTNLLSIINNILDLSKIEAGQIYFEENIFDLELILKNVIDLQSVKSKSKSIDLDFEMNENLQKYYKGDPVRVAQVLSNLVVNGIKFTENGGVKIIIEENIYKERKGNILFAVHDTGIGISEENKVNIFSPFLQADNTITRKFGGTGLGLSICKNLVELMNGEIWVESKENIGSIFYFTLNLELANNIEKRELLTPVEKINSKKQSKKNKRILLVDDSDENREIIKAYLKNSPYDFTEACNGIIGFEKFKTEKFDLIFLDMQMPEMDGITCIKLIRDWEQQHKKSPTQIIACSAHALKSEKKNFIDAGCSNYLSKPFRKKDLLSVIENEQNFTTNNKISA